jgi:hypothetical protein
MLHLNQVLSVKYNPATRQLEQRPSDDHVYGERGAALGRRKVRGAELADHMTALQKLGMSPLEALKLLQQQQPAIVQRYHEQTPPRVARRG